MAQTFFSSLGQPAQLHDGVNPLGFPRNPLVVRSGGKPTFRVVADAIAPATDKYMLLLHNANTSFDLVIQEIRAIHSNVSAATGVILKQTLLRISAFTTGTALTLLADDPETDTLPASISADTNSSAVTDVVGGLIEPAIFVTGEEMILAATAFQLNRCNLEGQLIYKRRDGERGLTLSGTTAANRGLAIKNLTASTEGSVSYVVVFTVEPTSGAPSV